MKGWEEESHVACMIADAPLSNDPRPERGRAGEKIARDNLVSQGYTILERNYRTRFGEIDIVVRSGETVAFIEVKARTNKRYGEPFEAVTLAKQGRIRRMAEAWLMANMEDESFRSCCFRFDVISILLDENGGAVECKHIVDAFR